MGHALNGVVVVKHHVFGRHTQQFVAALAYKLQFVVRLIVFVRTCVQNAAAVGHARQVIEQTSITFFHIDGWNRVG